MTRSRVPAAVCAALLLGACAGTSGTGTSPSAVAADATVTEPFSAVVPVSGAVFYSFTIAQYGNVAVTLTGITGDQLPDDVGLAIGIGQPSGITCSAASVTTVTPGDTAQVTGAWGPGVFCVRVADPGTLIAPVGFSAVVAHP
jgi:hypothetical protein